MKCEDVREKLLELADGEDLSAGGLGGQLEEHVAGCAGCREQLETLRRHRELLAQVGSPKAPAELWDRVESGLVMSCARRRDWRWWAAAAATVVAAVGLGLAVPRLLTAPVKPGVESPTVASTGQEATNGKVDFLMVRHEALEPSCLLNRALVTQSEQALNVEIAEEMQ